MISTNEMYVIEHNAIYNGSKVGKLMETAGKKIAKLISNRCKGKKVIFFCGQGNNGGDGFVVARHLRSICDIYVLFLGEKSKLTKESRVNYDGIVGDKRIKILKDLKSVDKIVDGNVVLVDSLLGIGVYGKLREPIKSAVEKFNNISGYKIAVDVESANKVQCDMIVALTMIKEPISLYKKDGTKKIVKVVNIGMPKNGYNYVGEGEVKSVLKSRKKSAQKGDSGRVLIVGGSRDYVGALALAGLAALRSGVDSVIIAAPEKVAYSVNCLSPDLVTRKFKGEYFNESDISSVLKLAKNADAVLVGNGLGRKSDKFVRKFVNGLEKLGKLYVLDADAVKAVDLKRCKTAVLTPNPREFELLVGDRNLKEIIGNNVVLIKGKVDKIVSKNKIRLNKTGNPGLAKAGTGDVLAGLLVGFLAQSKNRFNSACAASFVIGILGDKLLDNRKGAFSYIASDLLRDINEVLLNLA
jgi:ADP-dependent NAD(P)H-hydrate dehydratase / NAD(P)H-hydrate epimerase